MKLKLLMWNYLASKRMEMAKNHIDSNIHKSLLDIGCGKDMSFIKSLNGMEKIGLDLQNGSKVVKRLNLDNNSFDYVIMLATIEHLEYPNEILKECSRVLKSGGFLIITTPKDTIFLHTIEKMFFSENLKIYPNLHFFDKESLGIISSECFSLEKYKTFEFGLNQLFVFQKTPIDEKDKLQIGNPMELLH